ncbi:Putative SOS response-associated peptidase YedK [Roseovarius nanhaiticus]|uniref:Abasic site processing protein n=1 Tax=Roseovarius nanhaiticus TaxID=573024 RepID=A0A1N7HNJ7_9RHOB|nr:SOS response-associated peptidase family protein [Roseovarius nanhaiticus]SEL38334.1 Putative SOS response-associated peptidase YedK [Roseovarius nanhaiticus]SIS26437.1 Putative SOS response-associated peptidase YedK [Roseovarius nanhaiticus]
MCNLYSNTMPPAAMRQLFAVDAQRDQLGNAEPLPGIFPKGTAPIVALNDNGERALWNTHWGFVLPQVSKKTGQPIQSKAVNNARDDKLRTSPFWKKSFIQRRCLIPATSFCEAKGRNPATYFWFGVRGEGNRPPFAFAGVWRAFSGNYGGEQREMVTSSMVTTTPNELVRDTHPDRMPVILHPEAYEEWLTGRPESAFALLRPFPAEQMVIHQSGEGLKSDKGGL